MKTLNWRFLMTLAVCSLLPAMVAQAKDKVPRPLKMQAQSQQVWKGATILSADGWGVSSHCGLFDLAWDKEPPKDGFLSGSMTGANGDKIYFKWPVNNAFDVTITGGTGRFLGATGYYIVTLLSPPSRSFNPDTGITTITLTWTAAGEISY